MSITNISHQHITRYLCLLLIAIALSMLWFSTVNAQGPSLELTKSIQGDLSEIESGVPFGYLLSYRCASITQDCEGTVVTDPLPVELEYISAVTTPHINNVNYDAGSREVTFTFNEPLPAGGTGILQINVQFPPGTSPGTTAINDATIDATNGSPMTTDPVSIDSTGVFEMFPQKSIVGEAVEGFPTTFEVAVCSPDSSGGVNLTNPVLVDTLPADATFVTAEGTEGVDWVYDSDAHTVTFMNLPTATVGGCLSRTLSLQYDTIPTPATQTNTLTVTGTPEGCSDPDNLPAHCEGQTERTLGPVGLDFVVITPYSEGSGSKSSTSPSSFLGTEALPGEAITYTVGVGNTGYLTLTNVILTDTIPAEVEVSSFTIGPASDATASGFYQSDQTSGWQPFPANPYGANTTINVTELGLAAGDFVTMLRWEIGELPIGASSWNANVHTTVLAAIPAGTTFQNCADISANASDGNITLQSCNNASVIDQRAIPRTRKSADAGPYLPGDTAVFTARIQNDGVAHLDLENPVIVDLLPAQFEFVTGSYTITSTPAGAPHPNFTSIEDYNGTGQHLLRWEWNDQSGSGGTDARYSLAPGEEFVVQFEIEIVDGTGPARYQNNLAVTGWDGPANTLLCENSGHPETSYTDTGDLDGDGDSSEVGCQNADTEGFVDVGVFLLMDSQKSVLGQLDSDWNKLGLTVPGGTADYRLVITNTSNVSVTNLIAYDILPYVGDTGVIDSSDRESEWRPNLQGPITAASSIPLTVYYSVSQNPCRPEVVTGGPAGCVDDWTTTLPDDPTAVQALKFDFCDGGSCLELGRYSSVELIWPMVAPNESPTDPSCNNAFDPNDPLQFKTDNPACEIAWNSFGFTAEHEASGLSLPPAEPIKVGIRATDDTNISLGDFVWLDIAGIQNDGVQQPEEAGINGVRVELYDADTDTFLDYRITGPNDAGEPGYYLFSDLPPGNYYVRFFAPDGYTTSPANQGGDDATDSDGETPGTDPTYGDYLQSADITLAAQDITWDQGMWVEVDYGDAPSPYPTEASSIISPSLAARHIIVDGIHLGADVDAELDGQPNATATGDDADGNDDEDGVTFESFVGTPAEPVAIMAVGENSTIDISATVPATMTGYLNAWLDFNGDGDWDDPGEQIATNVSPSGGAINLSVSVPSDAQIGTTYARFRFGTEEDLSPTGTAIDGEVEDYQVELVAEPVKSIVATSEEHTGVVSGRENVAIGEIVRYRLVTQLPETTLTLMQLEDNLPNRLQFLDDGTAMVAFVSNGTLASDTLVPATLSCDGGANPNLHFTGDETTIDSITPECVLPDSAVGSNSSNSSDTDSYGNGTDIYFKLGTVSNSDGDSSQEFVIVEFNAILLNHNSSQAGRSSTNNFDWRVDNDADGNSEVVLRSNNALIRIAEPVLTLDKSLTSTSVDAGDRVTYTLMYENSASGNSAATAFDVVLTDTLDVSYLTLDLGSINIATSGTVTNTVDNSAGNSINVTVEGMEPGGSVTIEYAATVNNAVTAGQMITNTADLVYTSLPGDGTTGNPTGSDTPGASGDPDGERNGDDPDGVNDYTVSDSEVLMVNEGTLGKSLFGTSATHTTGSDVTIGEVLTYTLLVSVPEGTIPSIQVIDDLPAGLAYVDGSVTVDSSGFNGSIPAPTVSNTGGSGDDVTIDFGAVTVNVDNDASNNDFTIQLAALVVDVAGNVGTTPAQTTLTNNATVQIGSGTPQSTNPVEVTVVEPQMLIVKTMTPNVARVGDTVTVTLAISNTGTSTAFDVTMQDVVPTGMIYTAATLSQLSGPAVVLDDASAPTLSASWDTFAVGEISLIQFQATIDNDPPDTITNTATVNQATTLPGTDPNERDEPDVEDNDTLTIPVVVGDRVWYDNDFDGQQDSVISEPGVPGVLVTIYDATTNQPVEVSPGVAMTDITDANGEYLFDALPAGDYYVRFDLTTLPAGYIPTTANQGDDATDSDAGSNGQTANTGALAAGDEDLTLDLGIVQPAAIGNYVWVDENNDGYQDAGESGIANVTLELWDATHTTLLMTTTTDANGGYLFDDLVPGTYQVDVDETTLPAGMTQTALNLPNADFGNQDHGNGDGTEGYQVTVGAGEENLTADFGYNHNPNSDVDNPTGSPNAALGDKIWVDADGDGVQDPNEVPVSAVEVTLYHDPDGDGVYDTPYTVGGYTPTTTTDENGNYLFDDLPAGAYVVGVTNSGSASHDVLNSTDYAQTGDPDHFATDASNAPAGTAADNLSTQPIVLAPGDVFLNADFGYQPQGSAPVGTIGNTIWFDADADGVGPSTVNGDAGGNGDPAQTGGADDNEYGIEGVTVALIEDTNGNGTWDAGEAIIATDVTDANGQYLFEGLPLDDNGGDGDADYIVWVNDTDNVLDALRATYDADGESDSNGEEDASSVLGLSAVSIDGTDIAGGSNSDSAQDFGYTLGGHHNGEGLIGDTIFRDDDGNNSPDDGEGLEGVTVTLTDAEGNVTSTVTDENGHYWFGNLDPNGTYTVTVDTNTLPGGLSNSVDPDGGLDSVSVVDLSAGTDGNNDPDGIDNGINLGQDFGYVPVGTAGSIGNLVWLDQNADGINDGPDGPDSIANTDDDEAGIAGVTVDLYHDTNGNGEVDPGEPLMGSTTTDANGNYLFSNLPVDDGSGDMAYIVDVSDEAGVLAGHWHSLGSQAQSSDDNSKSDVYPVTLVDSDGQRDVLTADFGYYVEPAAVGNYVWLDLDRDGTQDVNEQGIPNVRVLLTIDYPDGTTITMTTSTDTNGHYSFANLLADEDYNGAGAGEPTFTISVDTTQTALSNYVPTIINSGNDLTDSDNYSGVSASPVQGLLDVSAQLPATNERTIASYDFGFYAEYGAIGNYIWVDENSDGMQDAGEAGIANVIVNLTNSDGTVYTTTTDASGYYLFPDLVSDTYTVTVPAANFAGNGALSGMEQTALTASGNPADAAYNADFGNKDDAGYAISLGAGEENLTADFGYNHNPTTDVDNPTGSPNAALGDKIWIDSDGDGVQDANEVPVSGVEVTLYHDPDGDGVYNTPYTVGGYTPTATTDSNGNYLFDDLPAGAYVVGVTDSSSASHDILNSGTYDQTGDPDHFGTDSSNAPSGTAGDNLSTQPIVLAPGDVFLNADFGYQPTDVDLGSIGDTIFFDADADGNGPSLAPVDGGAPVTQGAGGAADGDDYGIAGVSVSLIQDSNGNGVWDAGEPIIATDVTDANGQYLFSDLPISDGAGSDDYLVWVNDTNNVLDALSPTYDADGLSTPASGIVSGANISAVSDLDGTPVRSQDFGYTPEGQENGEGAIGDTIWFDINGSGGATQNAGEPGIEGIIVTLTNSSGNVITTTTDENGHYYFGGLDPIATYTVTVAAENFQAGGVLQGMSETYDPDGGSASQSVVDLNSSPNGIDLEQDFSYRATTPHGLGNLVWTDLDADGTYDPADGETPIGGVTVDLYRDLNGNGVVDAGEPLMATTVTSDSINAGIYGTDGNYIFDGLPDGNYIVDVTDVDGLLAGYWHSDGPDDDNDNNSQVDPYSATISGADNLTADFGYYVLPAAVGNYVWEDSNGDGIQDSDEDGIPNVVVTLVIDYPDGTSVTVNTTTDANGHYSFGNLLLDEDYNGDGAGEPTFTVSVDTNQAALSSYITTVVDVNSNANDLSDSDNHAGVAAQPTQGQTNTDAVDPVTSEPVIASQDFGFLRNSVGTIGNYLWVDENSDGLQDAGERGIPNVVVNLTSSDGTVYTTTTDASGHYLFADLSADTYTVTIPALNSGSGGALDGMTQTTSYPSPGTDLNNQNLNGGSGYVITLAAGEENLTADFGYNWNPTDEVNNPSANSNAALGDRIWMDSDGDGAQDPNEIGVEGVELTLYSDPDGNGVYDTVAYTTTTDANGFYIFDELPAGGYIVTVTDDTGASHDVLNSGNYSQTGDPDHFGTTGSDNDHSTTAPVILAPGDLFLNVDFGYQPIEVPLGSIGDTVWFDADASGSATVDAGEYGIAGVTVALIKDSNGDGSWTPLGADGVPGTADDEPIIGSDTTDSNGNYLFSDLPLDDGGGDSDADYLVWVNDTDNVLGSLVQTYDADGTGTPDISATALSSGSPDDLNQDFSYTPNGHSNGQGLIGDTIFADSDSSGTPDVGEGLEGVTVTLTDSGGNVSSTVTDENGHYWFGNLDPSGTYTVSVDTNTLPVGLTNSVDPDNGTANVSVVDLSADPDGTNDGINLGQDFGYVPSGTAGSIGNLVWLDQNADGINDGLNGPDNIASTDDDEAGIAGVTVELYHDVNGNGQVDAGEPLMGSSTTDANGNYLFSNLPVDDGGGDMAYVVDVTDEAGVLAGHWHSLGDQAQTSNDTSKSDSYPVTLTDADGERDVLTADFGYYVEGAAVGNYVWYDENGDGLQDSDEMGISGIPVTLTISYPNNDIITVVTTTDINGHYSFDNLLLDEDYNDAGSGQEPTYSISAGIPTGYNAIIVDAPGATDDLNDSDNHSGVNAQPVQGLIDTDAVDPVTNEPLIASYDFGLISTLDFGDLPASYSATMLSDDGPRHTVGSLHLGATVDVDRDGEPNNSAMGDDDVDGSDDEDGVIHTPGVRWQVGAGGASIDVSVTGTGGVLSLWIDWNQNGNFDEANEQILLDRSVAAGSETIVFDVPNGVSFNGDLNLRARLYDATTNGSATPMGYSGGVGEVEDYQWNFAALSVDLATFQATCQSNQVIVTWESVSELNNLGFNVYRSSSSDGPEVQLNASLIPSQVPGSGAGAYYEWIDSDYDNNSTNYYWIEDLDTGGTTSLHGPVSATCDTSESGMMQIYLPVIQR